MNASSKPRARFNSATGRWEQVPVRVRKKMGPPSRCPTAEQFDMALMELGSIARLAEHFDCSHVQVYRWAHKLFPGRNFRSGPGIQYVVKQLDTSGPVDVFRVRRVETPDTEGVDVYWDGATAYCTHCKGVRGPSAVCTHARAARRHILEITRRDER